MSKTSRKRVKDVEAIARAADRGYEVAGHFSGKGIMLPANTYPNRAELLRLTSKAKAKKPQIFRVNVDFTEPMLRELDLTARQLNISRQAVIKTLLRESLDRRLLAESRK